MESMLIRDRYKVIQVVRVQDDYAAVRAVDIQDRERPGRLINLYEGRLLHQYGPVYMNLDQRECPLFREFFLEGSTLAAVFDNTGGQPIDQVFFDGDKWKWRTRLEAAEALLHEALTLSNLPPEISCAALLSENVRPDPAEKKVELRFLVSPLEGMNGREAALLAGDQVKKILPRRWFSQPSELRFLDSLDRGEYRTLASLYAGWRAVREDIEKEYLKWEERNLIMKLLTGAKRLFQILRRWASSAWRRF